LKRLIAFAEKEYNLPCLHDFLTAVPTAGKGTMGGIVADVLLIVQNYRA